MRDRGGGGADEDGDGRPDECGPACAADWDGDGELGSDDFFAFVSDYFVGQGDFNTDGAMDSNDYFAFLTAYFEGCGS
jgi:hypothetical protein